jgi:hypothetical protein
MLQSPAFNRLTTAEIGRRAGFADASHFTKVIRAQTGQTPLQMRKGKRWKEWTTSCARWARIDATPGHRPPLWLAVSAVSSSSRRCAVTVISFRDPESDRVVPVAVGVSAWSACTDEQAAPIKRVFATARCMTAAFTRVLLGCVSGTVSPPPFILSVQRAMPVRIDVARPED